MNRSQLLIPSDVHRTVLDWFGADGQRWLAGLPEVVRRLTQEWRLVVGTPFVGGSASLVLEVTRDDGTPAVLKVPFLDEESRTEPDALRHYDGVGAVQLYDLDRHSGAMLLERVRPGTSLAMHPDLDEALEIACRLLRRLWRPPEVPHPFQTVCALAMKWAQEIPTRHNHHGRPFPNDLINQAAELAGTLAHADGSPVVVNRDAHLGNILASEREGWLLIDPKPLVGDRSFDAGYLLLDRLGQTPTPTAADKLVDKLALGLGVDQRGIRSWAILRAVENALWALDVRASPDADLAKAAVLSV
jgi:streptomycin 6-kinase